MYNRDVTGTRFNWAEKTLGKDNVDQLVEKWRFPEADSKEKLGVVHAVVVVKGCVYFGTETFPAFFKLTPDGKVKWVYRDPDLGQRTLRSALKLSFALPSAGFLNAALVTQDTVLFNDTIRYNIGYGRCDASDAEV